MTFRIELADEIQRRVMIAVCVGGGVISCTVSFMFYFLLIWLFATTIISIVAVAAMLVT